MKTLRNVVLLSLLLLLSATGLFASQGFEVSFNQPVSSEYDLEFELGDYRLNETQKNGKMFTEIDFAGSVVTNKKGFAALPYIHASVQLSNDRNVTTEIISTDYVEYSLNYPLLPSRGIIYRNQDPSTIPYEIADESIIDEFYPKDIAEATEPFILRDIRGTNVYVYPFQYNAARNILRVYTNVIVKLIENNTPVINPLISAKRKVAREMNSLYKTVFINYDETRFEHELADFGSILVIRTPRDIDAIAPYIQWKREKGFTVYEEEVVTGTNVISLVSSQYTAHNDILYVQLVGDWADIQGPTAGGAAADPNLGCVVGGDIYMDLIVGRFSANSTTHVTTQVNKTITYERDPDMGADWYKAAVGIASSQGAGIGDDGEADYEHMNVIWNDKLDPFTYDTYTPIYDPSANATMVANAVNAGTSIINYCGHGSMTSWVTSGFNNTHVNLLTNGDKLPFIISVACVNGAFDDGECFAEAWLKKDGAGAVGMFAGSINQTWAPP
ncbi:MAG: agmatine deiminase, partial [Candidatus Cloacimonetes bacterium]|nr:agmatine deiminase [Candidatus Cloacimonadota bacterium]